MKKIFWPLLRDLLKFYPRIWCFFRMLIFKVTLRVSLGILVEFVFSFKTVNYSTIPVESSFGHFVSGRMKLLTGRVVRSRLRVWWPYSSLCRHTGTLRCLKLRKRRKYWKKFEPRKILVQRNPVGWDGSSGRRCCQLPYLWKSSKIRVENYT